MVVDTANDEDLEAFADEALAIIATFDFPAH